MTTGTYTSTANTFQAYLDADISAMFAKAIGVQSITLDSKPAARIMVRLGAVKGNEANESGKKRIAKFMARAAELGIDLAEKRCLNSVDWKTLI